jgi:peroxiredoxin
MSIFATPAQRMFVMKHFPIALAAVFALTGPASADLPVGAPAPAFTTQATLAGKPFTFSLQSALSRGPVVLYFYPAAFTSGCTAEAHDFAEATDAFAALGATVIGVSADDIETLNRFSVEACRSKFAVASDADRKIMTAYDAVMAMNPDMADRTSYVISPEGKVIYAFTAMAYDDHVKNTMDAVKAWRSANP